MKSGPTESEEEKRARERERRQSLLERRDAAQSDAGDLTQDLARVYGARPGLMTKR